MTYRSRDCSIGGLDRRLSCRGGWLALVLLLPALAMAAETPGPNGVESQHAVTLQEAWIPMPDGVRLAVDLYSPNGVKAGERLPVLLEYLPYRKTESRSRNYGLYSYFVERGYIVARVDIRGTGNSEGRLIPHEYSDIEHQDGEIVIDWLSRQPWSRLAIES